MGKLDYSNKKRNNNAEYEYDSQNEYYSEEEDKDFNEFPLNEKYYDFLSPENCKPS
jgi:hypothetical protein